MAILSATGVSECLEDSLEAGREAAAMIKERLALAANSVGILLCSIEFDLAEVIKGVRLELDIPLIGATTYSEATSDGYFEDAVTLMVLSSDALQIGLGVGENLGENPQAACREAWEQAVNQINCAPKLAVVFPDAGLNFKGEEVIRALQGLNADRIPVVGGCPGDGGRFQKTFQVLNDQIYTDSVPLLLLGGEIDACVTSVTGWRPMGHHATITEADGNRLLKVDNRPTIEFLQRYIPNMDDPDIAGAYPIALMEETVHHKDRHHYVIRSPFFTDDAGAVVYGGMVPEGSTIQMGHSTREMIYQSIDDATARLKLRLGKRAPACVLFASCGARKLMLGIHVEKEINGIKQGLGEDLPIQGFYSYGEIGAYDSADQTLNDIRYHNNTLSMCAIY